MTRTQIQLPDELYNRAKRLAAKMEISLAEVTRRGLEYMLSVSCEEDNSAKTWELPRARSLGGRDPFADPDWRSGVHTRHLKVAESNGSYGKDKSRT